MAKAYMCDQCGKLITEDEIRITLNGYAVLENENSKKIPVGYEFNHPQEFCSFTCLSEWATEEQKMLEDYMRTTEKYRRIDNER